MGVIRDIVSAGQGLVLREEQGSKESIAPGEHTRQRDSQSRRVGAATDDRVRAVLQTGDIMLMKATWIRENRKEGNHRRICKRRQEMPPDAFVPPQDAAQYFEESDRSVAVVSYGWITRDQ